MRTYQAQAQPQFQSVFPPQPQVVYVAPSRNRPSRAERKKAAEEKKKKEQKSPFKGLKTWLERIMLFLVLGPIIGPIASMLNSYISIWALGMLKASIEMMRNVN